MKLKLKDIEIEAGTVAELDELLQWAESNRATLYSLQGNGSVTSGDSSEELELLEEYREKTGLKQVRSSHSEIARGLTRLQILQERKKSGKWKGGEKGGDKDAPALPIAEELPKDDGAEIY